MVLGRIISKRKGRGGGGPGHRVQVLEDGKMYVRIRPEDPKYRALLSIDGGGVRGIIPAIVLKGFETAVKQVVREMFAECKDASDDDLVVDVSECFDVVAGNSAGSILALYVASGGGRPELYEEGGSLAGYRPGSAEGAVKLYTDLVQEIFNRPWYHPARIPAVGSAVGLFSAKYGNTGLANAMDRVFGNLTMGHLKMDAYVPAYEINNARAVAFFSRARSGPEAILEGTETGYAYVDPPENGVRGRKHATFINAKKEDIRSRGGSFRGIMPGFFDCRPVNLPIKVAAQASASAPTYFTTATFEREELGKYLGLDSNKVQWVDGGIVCNNPTMQALAFMATSHADKDTGTFLSMNRMAVLSLGTGTRRLQPAASSGGQGLLSWVPDLVNILMESQTEVNHTIIDALFDEAVFGRDHGASDRYVRINRVVPFGHPDYDVLGALDAVQKVQDLEKIGEDLVDKEMGAMKDFVRYVLMESNN